MVPDDAIFTFISPVGDEDVRAAFAANVDVGEGVVLFDVSMYIWSWGISKTKMTS